MVITWAKREVELLSENAKVSTENIEAVKNIEKIFVSKEIAVIYIYSWTWNTDSTRHIQLSNNDCIEFLESFLSYQLLIFYMTLW